MTTSRRSWRWIGLLLGAVAVSVWLVRGCDRPQAPHVDPPRADDGVSGEGSGLARPDETPGLRGTDPGDEGARSGLDRVDRLRLCDLATGHGVTALRVWFATATGSVDASSDGDGVVERPPGAERIEWIESSLGPWTLAPGQSLDGGEDLWIYRTVRLHGVVRVVGAEEDFDIENDLKVEVLLVSLPMSEITELGGSPFPWNEVGAKRFGDAFVKLSGNPRADGTFEFDIPASRGLVARCSGTKYDLWCPSWRDVPVPSPGEREVFVEIEVRRKPILRGRIELAPGVDPDKAAFRAITLFRFTPPHFDVARARLYGTSIGVGVGASEASVCLHTPVKVSADGSFEAPLQAYGGDVLLVVHAPQHAPARVLFRRLEGNVDSIRLVPQPTPLPSGIGVTIDGEPARGGGVNIVDVTDTPFQPMQGVPLDENGAMREHWLERGRAYWLIVGRQVEQPDGTHRRETLDGLMFWGGERTIEVTDLRQDVNAFLREVRGK